MLTTPLWRSRHGHWVCEPCLTLDKLMHPATPPDVASPNLCRFDQPHCSVNHWRRTFPGLCLTQATSLKAEEENKHIFRSKGSKRSIRKTEGENRRGSYWGEMERLNMKDNTGNIKRRGRQKGYNVGNRAGSGRERLATFDQILNVFSKKHVSQPSLLKRNNIGVIEECTVGVVDVLSQCTIKRGLKVKPIVN